MNLPSENRYLYNRSCGWANPSPSFTTPLPSSEPSKHVRLYRPSIHTCNTNLVSKVLHVCNRKHMKYQCSSSYTFVKMCIWLLLSIPIFLFLLVVFFYNYFYCFLFSFQWMIMLSPTIRVKWNNFINIRHAMILIIFGTICPIYHTVTL